jgi:hypothetical protein
MSSILRTFATPVRVPSKYTNISTPSYNESAVAGGQPLPIPFTVVNQTLDIDITTPSVQNFITNGSSPDDDSEYQAKLMGGKELVTSLGANLKTYLNNLIDQNDGLGAPYTGPLVIYVNPTMTRAQLAQPGNVTALAFENVYGVNDQPPTSDEYAGGDFTNKYFATWVFYSPLTVRYVSAASTTGYRYITFTTHYDAD